MASVTIDAGVLAVPSEINTANDVYAYIDTIMDWKKLLDEPWIAIYMSERASEVLFDHDLYPFRDHLKKIFNTHGIVEYDVNTIARIVDHLLQLTPSFETYYSLKDVLADSLVTDPDIISLSTHQGLQSDLARCIIFIAILRKHCSQSIGDHSLILRNAPRQVIKIKAQIHELEHERIDIPALPSPPEYFKGDVLVCDDFKGLINCLNESIIFLSATDQIGIEIAIRIAFYKNQITMGFDPDWDGCIVPSIGEEFLKTVRNCCKDQPEALSSRILRAIIETIAGQNLAAVHSLRTGSGGNNPQRLRGNDKAQRRDIDYDFHLHYWECDDGQIELASIVYHNDFSIPE